MKERIFQLTWIGLLLGVLWLMLGETQMTMAAENVAIEANTILVQFDDNVGEAERDMLIHQMNGELVNWLPVFHTAQVRINFASELETASAILARSESDPRIVSIEADGLVSGLPILEESIGGQGTIPAMLPPVAPVTVNDPYANNAQFVYALSLMQVPMAWNYTMGSPEVIIAVVDSGVTLNHPDLIGRIHSGGYDFVNKDNDPSDDQGHGTHVAGIIAATANNGIGSAGICPGCTILPVKVLDHNNSGSWFNVASGIVYAVDNGARVINLSLGGQSAASIMQDAVNYALMKDVLVVAAAGNSRSDSPFYPAAFEGVVGVSGTNSRDERWGLSNFGSYVDLSAPGFAVFSTYKDLANSYEGYTFMSGTSMASPQVVGLAGLLLSQDKSRTSADLIRLMTSTAVDLGAAGWDAEFGHGRINVFAALRAEVPVPTADRRLSGIIWQDNNGNGLLDLGEDLPVEAVNVHVWNESMGLVASVSTNVEGVWAVENLLPAVYEVRIEVSDRLRPLTSSSLQVDTTSTQQFDNLNFGLLPFAPTENQETLRVFLPMLVSQN